MSDKSAIQWTDATWNPTTGCTKVSPGCANCYIERTPAFRIHGRKFVKGATDLRLHNERVEQPLHWKKPRRVFVNSLSDLFHPDVPDAFIDQVFAVMAWTPRHTFQVLTKRPDRMHEYMKDVEGKSLGPIAGARGRIQNEIWRRGGTWGMPWPLPNVWLGVSVENQHFADERIPLLLQTPAAVRFISAEPLLEAIDLHPPVDNTYRRLWPWYHTGQFDEASVDSAPPCPERRNSLFPKLDWVIVGGESGRVGECRVFDIAWARSIVAQCRSAGVPCFVKQLGSDPVNELGTMRHPSPGSGTQPIVDSKGGDPAEWPADLRIREFPEVRS